MVEHRAALARQTDEAKLLDLVALLRPDDMWLGLGLGPGLASLGVLTGG